MTALKATLVFLVIWMFADIVVTLCEISIVAKNKGRVDLPRTYFFFRVLLLAASCAALVIIW